MNIRTTGIWIARFRPTLEETESLPSAHVAQPGYASVSRKNTLTILQKVQIIDNQKECQPSTLFVPLATNVPAHKLDQTKPNRKPDHMVKTHTICLDWKRPWAEPLTSVTMVATYSVLPYTHPSVHGVVSFSPYRLMDSMSRSTGTNMRHRLSAPPAPRGTVRFSCSSAVRFGSARRIQSVLQCRSGLDWVKNTLAKWKGRMMLGKQRAKSVIFWKRPNSPILCRTSPKPAMVGALICRAQRLLEDGWTVTDSFRTLLSHQRCYGAGSTSITWLNDLTR